MNLLRIRSGVDKNLFFIYKNYNMKKLLMLMTLLFIMKETGYAQTETNKYYLNGTTSIGRGAKIFADTSAWLHIGSDTTNKGIIIPNVIIDSVHTAKRGLFVYSLKDSVLYHLDDTNKVRYMTYRDTTMIKNLIGSGETITTNKIQNTYSPAQPYLKIEGDENLLLQAVDGDDGSIILGLTGVSPDFTTVATSTTKSGVVINRDITPISGSSNLHYNAFEINNLVNFTNSTGNNIYRGIYYNPTISGNVEQRGLELNNANGWGVYQPNTGVKNMFSGQTSFANGSLTDNSGNVTVSIGRVSSHKASLWVTDNSSFNSDKCLASFTTNQSSEVEFAVKALNSNTTAISLATGKGSGFYSEEGKLGYFRFNSLTATGDFHGYYINNYGQNGAGTTSGSNAYSFISGGQFATANTEVGTVIDFWAKNWNTTSYGNITSRYGLKIDYTSTYITNPWGVYQSDSGVKNYFNGNTSFGSTNNSSKVDITGTTGYNQLRLRNSYTPTGTSDINGSTGDVSWDDNYFYVKTSQGWKRTNLATF